MKKETCFALSVAFFATTLLNSLPAQACAGSIDPYFTYTNHPDFPLDKYAAGRLGILQSGYARSYLLPAYRYLSGSPLSADEQQGIVELWNSRLGSSDINNNIDAGTWIKARSAVPGASKLSNIDTEHSVSKEERYQTYCNCQTDAFSTAAKTLQGLVNKFGAGSAAVREWLNAQDQVFSNCGDQPYGSDKPHPAVIPAPLSASADASAQKNRAYQIASANFYAQNFELARQQFEAIAADSSSPWKQLSGYLAVRALIRQATLSKELNDNLLKAAAQKLAQLAKDPSYAALAQDIAELASFVAARVNPQEHLHELASKKYTTETVAEITKTIDILIGDQGEGAAEVKYNDLAPSLKQKDDIDWVMTFQAGDEAGKHHAVERWKQTRALPWLVAAAADIDAHDASAGALLAAASQVKAGPAHWTLFFHANRLRLALGKNDEVRAELDRVLNNPPADLPAGSLNELKTQRLGLARSLDEVVRFGVQNPVAICYSGGMEQVPDDMDEINKSGKIKKQPAEFIPEAGNVLQETLPLSVLKQLASNAQLPQNLRNNVAFTSWVRAVLVGDEAAARELAKIASPLNKARSKFFDAYLAAATPEERKFAAVFLMLHFSSAEPNARSGILSEDGYGDASGWWWGEGPAEKPATVGDSDKPVGAIVPLFLTAAQKAQSKQEYAKLGKVEAAPNYFAGTVFAFAKTHPADPRVPEALHWLVKSTHWGSTDDKSKVYSKQAFTLLHNKYKTSPWTKKTPYYY